MYQAVAIFGDPEEKFYRYILLWASNYIICGSGILGLCFYKKGGLFLLFFAALSQITYSRFMFGYFSADIWFFIPIALVAFVIYKYEYLLVKYEEIT